MTATAVAELSVTGNDRIAMGANMTPFDAHKVNIDDLFEEAQTWLDGGGVSTDAEAKAVEQLLDMAREAKKAAEADRKIEAEPFDAGKKAVQAKYVPIIDRADLIVTTCRDVLSPWRERIETEKRAAAEAARAEAERKAVEAQEAIRASAGNVAERERAESLLKDAKRADRTASRTERSATTGNGLRARWVARLTDRNAAIKHYWEKNANAFEELVVRMAERDTLSGAREIPGFIIEEQKVAV